MSYIKLTGSNIEVYCVAFTDDLVILTRDITAQKQIEIVKEIAERVGVQTSFKKKGMLDFTPISPKVLLHIIREIKYVS